MNVAIATQERHEYPVPPPIKQKKQGRLLPDDDANKSRSQKQKRQKLTDEDAKNLVINYMKSQNRPYSAQNIFDNLRGVVTRSTLQRLLDDISCGPKLMPVDDKENSHDLSQPIVAPLLCKEYGKFKIYLINQDLFDNNHEAEASIIDKDALTNLEFEVQSLLSEVKELEKSSALDLYGHFSSEELLQIKAELEAKLELKQQNLANLLAESDHEKTTINLNEENVSTFSVRHQEAHREWKLRRDVCYSLLGYVASSMELSIQDTMFELGVDSDDDYGFVMPDNLS